MNGYLCYFNLFSRRHGAWELTFIPREDRGLVLVCHSAMLLAVKPEFTALTGVM